MLIKDPDFEISITFDNESENCSIFAIVLNTIIVHLKWVRLKFSTVRFVDRGSRGERRDRLLRGRVTISIEIASVWPPLNPLISNGCAAKSWRMSDWRVGLRGAGARINARFNAFDWTRAPVIRFIAGKVYIEANDFRAQGTWGTVKTLVWSVERETLL